MREALLALGGIEERLGRLAPRSVAERLAHCDLRAGALTLRAVLEAGIGRKESRGSFLRSDCPSKDDSRWRCNSCLRYDAASGGFTVDGAGLSFGPLATTRAACPPGSLSDAFLQQLSFVRAWGFRERRLVLASLVDGTQLELH